AFLSQGPKSHVPYPIYFLAFLSPLQHRYHYGLAWLLSRLIAAVGCGVHTKISCFDGNDSRVFGEGVV
ncbi:hypothetical protein, partial [Laspinema olomoucense]|uniref:hypothetical protein n=1 Tax=Laspinema olomoucense TaxID=3231600 RepID=UPI0021BB8CD8